MADFPDSTQAQQSSYALSDKGALLFYDGQQWTKHVPSDGQAYALSDKGRPLFYDGSKWNVWSPQQQAQPQAPAPKGLATQPDQTAQPDAGPGQPSPQPSSGGLGPTLGWINYAASKTAHAAKSVASEVAGDVSDAVKHPGAIAFGAAEAGGKLMNTLAGAGALAEQKYIYHQVQSYRQANPSASVVPLQALEPISSKVYGRSRFDSYNPNSGMNSDAVAEMVAQAGGYDAVQKQGGIPNNIVDTVLAAQYQHGKTMQQSGLITNLRKHVNDEYAIQESKHLEELRERSKTLLAQQQATGRDRMKQIQESLVDDWIKKHGHPVSQEEVATVQAHLQDEAVKQFQKEMEGPAQLQAQLANEYNDTYSRLKTHAQGGTFNAQKLAQEEQESGAGKTGSFLENTAEFLTGAGAAKGVLKAGGVGLAKAEAKQGIKTLAKGQATKMLAASIMQAPSAIKGLTGVDGDHLTLADWAKENLRGVVMNRLLVSPTLSEATDFSGKAGIAAGIATRSAGYAAASELMDPKNASLKDFVQNVAQNAAFESMHVRSHVKDDNTLSQLSKTYASKDDALRAQHNLIDEIIRNPDLTIAEKNERLKDPAGKIALLSRSKADRYRFQGEEKVAAPEEGPRAQEAAVAPEAKPEPKPEPKGVAEGLKPAPEAGAKVADQVQGSAEDPITRIRELETKSKRQPLSQSEEKELLDLHRQNLVQGRVTKSGQMIPGMLNTEGWQQAHTNGELGMHRVSMDLDGLKKLNLQDPTGTLGNRAIAIAGKYMSEEVGKIGGKSVLESGDEFRAAHNDHQALQEAMERVRDRAANTTITWTDEHGQEHTQQGFGLSFGMASSDQEADNALKADKDKRKAEGKRFDRDELERRHEEERRASERGADRRASSDTRRLPEQPAEPGGGPGQHQVLGSAEQLPPAEAPEGVSAAKLNPHEALKQTNAFVQKMEKEDPSLGSQYRGERKDPDRLRARYMEKYWDKMPSDLKAFWLGRSARDQETGATHRIGFEDGGSDGQVHGTHLHDLEEEAFRHIHGEAPEGLKSDEELHTHMMESMMRPKLHPGFEQPEVEAAKEETGRPGPTIEPPFKRKDGEYSKTAAVTHASNVVDYLRNLVGRATATGEGEQKYLYKMRNLLQRAQDLKNHWKYAEDAKERQGQIDGKVEAASLIDKMATGLSKGMDTSVKDDQRLLSLEKRIHGQDEKGKPLRPKAPFEADTMRSSSEREAMSQGYDIPYDSRSELIKNVGQYADKDGRIQSEPLLHGIAEMAHRKAGTGMKWEDFKKDVQAHPGKEVGGLEFYPHPETGLPVPVPKTHHVVEVHGAKTTGEGMGILRERAAKVLSEFDRRQARSRSVIPESDEVREAKKFMDKSPMGGYRVNADKWRQYIRDAARNKQDQVETPFGKWAIRNGREIVPVHQLETSAPVTFMAQPEREKGSESSPREYQNVLYSKDKYMEWMNHMASLVHDRQSKLGSNERGSWKGMGLDRVPKEFAWAKRERPEAPKAEARVSGAERLRMQKEAVESAKTQADNGVGPRFRRSAEEIRAFNEEHGKKTVEGLKDRPVALVRPLDEVLSEARKKGLLITPGDKIAEQDPRHPATAIPEDKIADALQFDNPDRPPRMDMAKDSFRTITGGERAMNPHQEGAGSLGSSEISGDSQAHEHITATGRLENQQRETESRKRDRSAYDEVVRTLYRDGFINAEDVHHDPANQAREDMQETVKAIRDKISEGKTRDEVRQAFDEARRKIALEHPLFKGSTMTGETRVTDLPPEAQGPRQAAYEYASMPRLPRHLEALRAKVMANAMAEHFGVDERVPLSEREQQLVDRLEGTGKSIGESIPLASLKNVEMAHDMPTERQEAFLDYSHLGHHLAKEELFQTGDATPYRDESTFEPEEQHDIPIHGEEPEFSSDDLAGEKRQELFRGFAENALRSAVLRLGKTNAPEAAHSMVAHVMEQANLLWDNVDLPEHQKEGSLKDARMAVWNALGEAGKPLIERYNAKMDRISQAVSKHMGEDNHPFSEKIVNDFYGKLDPALINRFKLQSIGEGEEGHQKFAGIFNPVTGMARLFKSFKDLVRGGDTNAKTRASHLLLHETMHFLEAATGENVHAVFNEAFHDERNAFGEQNPWYKNLVLDSHGSLMGSLADRQYYSNSGMDAGTSIGESESNRYAKMINEHRQELKDAGFVVTEGSRPEVISKENGRFMFQHNGDGYTFRHPVHGDMYRLYDPSEYFAETGAKYLNMGLERRLDPATLSSDPNLSAALMATMNDHAGVLNALPEAGNKVARLILDAMGQGKNFNADTYAKARSKQMAEYFDFRRRRDPIPTRALIDGKQPPLDYGQSGKVDHEAPDASQTPADLMAELQLHQQGAIDKMLARIQSSWKDVAKGAKEGAARVAGAVRGTDRNSLQSVLTAGNALFATDRVSDASLMHARLMNSGISQVFGRFHTDVIHMADTYEHLQKQVSFDQSKGVMRRLERAVKPDMVGENGTAKVFIDMPRGRGEKFEQPERMGYTVKVDKDGKILRVISDRQMAWYNYLQSDGLSTSSHIDPDTRGKLDKAIRYKKDAAEQDWNALRNTPGVDKEGLDKIKSQDPMYVMQSYWSPGSLAGIDPREAENTGMGTELSTALSKGQGGRLEEKRHRSYAEALEAGKMPKFDNPVDALTQGSLHLNGLRLFRETVHGMEESGVAIRTLPENIKDKKLWVPADLVLGETGASGKLGFTFKGSQLTEEQGRQLEAGKLSSTPKLFVRSDMVPLLNSVYGSGLEGSQLFRKLSVLNSALIPIRLAGIFHLGVISDLRASVMSGAPINVYRSALEGGASHAEAAVRAAKAPWTEMASGWSRDRGRQLKDLLVEHGHRPPSDFMSDPSLTDRAKATLLMSQAGQFDIMENPLRDRRGRMALGAALQDLDTSDIQNPAAAVARALRGSLSVGKAAVEAASEKIQRAVMTGFVMPMKLGHIDREIQRWLDTRYGDRMKDGGWLGDLQSDLAKGSRSIDGAKANEIFDRADDVFGLLNYRRLFLDPKVKHALQLTEQAFGWHFGTNRLMLKSLGELSPVKLDEPSMGGKVGKLKLGLPSPGMATSVVAGSMAFHALLGTISNMLGASHRRDDDNPMHTFEDTVAPRFPLGGGKGNVRLTGGYMPEFLGAMESPKKYAVQQLVGGKSPVADMIIKAATGRRNYSNMDDWDNQGLKIGPAQDMPLLSKEEKRKAEAYIKGLEEGSALDKTHAYALRVMMEAIEGNQPYVINSYQQSTEKQVPLPIKLAQAAGAKKIGKFKD